VPARAVVLENAPLNREMTFHARGSDPIQHLLNFTGDRRTAGARQLRDFASVEGIRAGIHSGLRPQRVLLAPERRPIAFGWKDGRVWFQTAAHFAPC
jgi:hypothetical protein